MYIIGFKALVFNIIRPKQFQMMFYNVRNKTAIHKKIEKLKDLLTTCIKACIKILKCMPGMLFAEKKKKLPQ